MYLKLLGPFYTGFEIAPGKRTGLAKDYLSFWDNLQKTMSSGPSPLQGESSVYWRNKDSPASQPELYFNLQFKHQTPLKDKPLYSFIDEDTLPLPIEVMRIKLVDPTDYIQKKLENLAHEVLSSVELQNMADRRILDFIQPSELFIADIDGVEINIYDYGIGLFVIPIKILHSRKIHSQNYDYQFFLEILRNIGIDFAALQVQEFYQNYLSVLLSDLAKKAGHHFQNNEIITCRSIDLKNQVLWVTRTLIFESGDVTVGTQKAPALNSLAWIQDYTKYWLKDTGIPESYEDVSDNYKGIYSLQDILNNSNTYSMSWLNYLFREEVAQDEIDDAFEAMSLAQYYYAALERLNNELHKIIGVAFSPDAEEDIRSLNRDLKILTNRTNMLITEYREMQKYLKRRKKRIFEQIMRGWFFEEIIENAEKKLELCFKRIDSLYQISSTRNTFLTDALLLIIGMLSIIDLSIGLSEYGRTLNTDATLGVRNESTWFLNLFAQAPSDVMMLASFLFIVCFVGLYLVLRRKTLL